MTVTPDDVREALRTPGARIIASLPQRGGTTSLARRVAEDTERALVFVRPHLLPKGGVERLDNGSVLVQNQRPHDNLRGVTPSVVVVDDAQYADRDAVMLLLAPILTATPDTPLLLLTTGGVSPDNVVGEAVQAGGFDLYIIGEQFHLAP